MPFAYSYFISYCHGQEALTTFVEQLQKALDDELSMHFDYDSYLDTQRLLPGYQHNVTLARAICSSICMIVVYTPNYERHSYCLREYQAMEDIATRRKQLLGESAVNDFTPIIPVILREEPPAKIKGHIVYCDFSRFSLGTLDIHRNPEYLPDIRRIARTIYQNYQIFEASGVDVCHFCPSFTLPSEQAIRPWRERPQRFGGRFPGREVSS